MMNSTTARSDAAAEPAATPSQAAIERLLRRSILLLTRPNTTVQDRLDLADLAEAVGAPGIATPMRDLARLRQGFATGAAPAELPLNSIERAVAELRGLMTDLPEIVLSTPATADAPDPVTACSALCRLLEAPLDEGAERALTNLLAGLRLDADIDPRDHISVPLDELVAMFAGRELRAFLDCNHDLAFAPFGSAALLHRVARFGHGGLGPYLSQIANVVRSGSDVIGLIALAAGQGAVAMTRRWTVPLTAYLPDEAVSTLANELGDLGLADVLRDLTTAAGRRSQPHGLLRTLRDAALDLGDLETGISAQRVLLEKTALDAAEWRRLGDMLATAGDTMAAETAFNRALKLSPADEDAQSHLAALQGGDFGPFSIDGGFSTPMQRRQLRFARRAA
jgi:hypothetical protein